MAHERPRVEVSPACYLLAALVIACRWERDVGTVVLLVLAHEAAHAVAVWLLRGHVAALHITPFGLRMRSRGSLTPGEEALAVAAGPCVNLALAALLDRCGAGGAATQSLALGIYNLLPAKGLDGGRLLAIFLPEWGEKAAKAMAWVLALGLMAVAARQFFDQEPFWVPLCGAWMLILLLE